MKQKLVALLIVFVTGSLFSGCSGIDLSEIKLGYVGPLTGEIASFGQSSKNGALLAEQEINTAGGISINGSKRKVKFLIEDDQNNPDQSVKAFKKLIDQDKVLGIVGSVTSSCSIPAAAVAEAAGTPQIATMATNPEVTRGRKYVYRACFIDPFQGKVAALFALEKLNLRTAAVLFAESPYNRGIAEVFRDEYTKAGGTIVGFEAYPVNKNTDFIPQLSKIKEGRPTLLFLPNFYSEIPLQAKQARQLGISAKLIGADGWDNADLLKNAGTSLDGAYFTNHYSPQLDNPITADFNTRYRAQYHEMPDATAALSYDAANILIQAIERSGVTDRKAINRSLAQTRNYPGVSGEISFEGSGDPVKGGVIIRIQNGRFVFDSSVNI